MFGTVWYVESIFDVTLEFLQGYFWNYTPHWVFFHYNKIDSFDYMEG